ncbi:nodulin MtN21 /EamA-like transporter family protein [Artemisia annua]|uniref:Nodulin MtN21 /EamA-like transporter family protein n=1 Tax=Artemisia annua TaxID=35608 RepID=A0A2U1LPT6_ARTAN|nr:nodulin MtN21 /EamA-like transporter family protein [Artemisia annua]
MCGARDSRPRKIYNPKKAYGQLNANELFKAKHDTDEVFAQITMMSELNVKVWDLAQTVKRAKNWNFMTCMVANSSLSDDGKMASLEYYKPIIVMVVLQFTYGAVSISSRASLLEGMNPRVFVVYRQAIGFLIISPIAYFSRSKLKCSIGWKSFSLIFLAALIGLTTSQMIFLEGLYLASSSAASAMFNLVPAITFVVASIVGYEPINIRSVRTIAKILGTLVCVTGAAAMALIKGPKLLNAQLPPSNSLLLNTSDQSDTLWLLGCLCLFGSSCCWSFWLIIQVPVSRNFPDHLSLSAWMCFTATIQSAVVVSFTDPNIEAWKVGSYLQLGSLLYAGIVGSGISIFAQSWIIQKRGPVFSAMFNPLNTVIVAIFASIFLQEQIYVGGAVGAVGIVMGLYVVLWGKAKDLEELKEEQEKQMMIAQNEDIKNIQVLAEPIAGNRASSSVLLCLKSLSLRNVDFTDGIEASSVFQLIFSSRNLLTLKIKATFDYNKEGPQSALNFDFASMRQLQLQSVNLFCIRDSENEVCLIKSLLACSPVLQKMDLFFLSNPRGDHDNAKLTFALKLLKLERASPKAQIKLSYG